MPNGSRSAPESDVGRKPRRRPTLEQVAAYAGVSRATVSRVVNGVATVDPEIARVVQDAVDDLQYVPNFAARSLMTRRTDTIMLVANETDRRVFGDPFFAQIVRGVSQELNGTGVQLALSMTHSDEDVAELTRYLRGGHTDGVLIISEHGRHHFAADLVSAGVHVVIGGRPMDPYLEVPFVDNDNIQGGRLAAKHLRSSGRTRIGTITGPLDMSAGADRLEGFRLGMGKSFRKGLVETGAFTTESGRAAMRALLERHPDLDGVFVASDLMAIGAMAELRHTGRSIPGDVAVVGFDDIELAAMSEPPLTTVRQRTAEQGRLMVRLLFKALGREHGALPAAVEAGLERSVVQPVELVSRSSA